MLGEASTVSMFFCNTCGNYARPVNLYVPNPHRLLAIILQYFILGNTINVFAFLSSLLYNSLSPSAGQALCGPCREDTHKAKMFSQHDIIHISMKSKQRNQKVIFLSNKFFSLAFCRFIYRFLICLQCPSHGEQLSMFCTTTRALLCMKCFSEASLETRLHCVDVDIAYDQARKRLDRIITASFDHRLFDACLQFKKIQCKKIAN